MSRPGSIRMIETPTSASPARIARCIGAAPRHRGSSEACTLIAPSLATSSTGSGRINPYAATQMTSASDRSSSRTTSESRSVDGCRTGIPSRAARPDRRRPRVAPSPGHGIRTRVVHVPAGVAALQVGASLGLVIGRAACRVTAAEALAHVAGYPIVNDVSVPHASLYRPSARASRRATASARSARAWCPRRDAAHPGCAGRPRCASTVVLAHEPHRRSHAQRRAAARRRHRVHDAATGRRADARRRRTVRRGPQPGSPWR